MDFILAKAVEECPTEDVFWNEAIKRFSQQGNYEKVRDLFEKAIVNLENYPEKLENIYMLKSKFEIS